MNGVWEIPIVQGAHNSRLEEGACSVVKNIGKPEAGKLHVRFDEGGLGTMTRQFRRPLNESDGNRQAESKGVLPALYSTQRLTLNVVLVFLMCRKWLEENGVRP
jgi:hypothetical protein